MRCETPSPISNSISAPVFAAGIVVFGLCGTISAMAGGVLFALYPCIQTPSTCTPEQLIKVVEYPLVLGSASILATLIASAYRAHLIQSQSANRRFHEV